MSARILMVEDEPGLVMTVGDRLQAEGYEFEAVTGGDAGLARALEGRHDLLILDWMLPGKSGLDICRLVRKRGIEVPVLMLTARSQVVDKVVGLQVGADDYLTKPFDMLELVARVEALLRRAAKPHAAREAVAFGDVRVDLKAMEATRGNQPVQLSAREFQLLKYLLERPGQTVTREELLTNVWGYEPTINTRTVDVHLAWLRQKLEPNPRQPQYIVTVRGLGYRFSA
jgi:two-component system alkaline phosphatase synthesis response regulator PhoP